MPAEKANADQLVRQGLVVASSVLQRKTDIISSPWRRHARLCRKLTNHHRVGSRPVLYRMPVSARPFPGSREADPAHGSARTHHDENGYQFYRLRGDLAG
jgi:hypothetical protein